MEKKKGEGNIANLGTNNFPYFYSADSTFTEKSNG